MADIPWIKLMLSENSLKHDFDRYPVIPAVGYPEFRAR
jgi:hypothetical protein